MRPKKNSKTTHHRSSSKRRSLPSKGGRGVTHKDSSTELNLKGLRVIVGTHAIRESFTISPKTAKALWLKRNWVSHQDLVEIEALAKKWKIPVFEKPDSHIEEYALSHQGALLFQSWAPEWPSLAKFKNQEKCQLLLLDGLEDPHNLGAILRTAWLMGVQGVLVPEHRAVHLTPVVHKIASGGAEHVPVLIVPQFAQEIQNLKEAGFWVFGLSHRAQKSLFQTRVPEKVVWCIGAEDKGLRSTTEKLCDEVFSLPQLSADASYNASVAAAMVVFETFRQHSLNS